MQQWRQNEEFRADHHGDGNAGASGRERWLTGTRGHSNLVFYQQRYKSFPVQDDYHFFVVCRYVQRNALNVCKPFPVRTPHLLELVSGSRSPIPLNFGVGDRRILVARHPGNQMTGQRIIDRTQINWESWFLRFSSGGSGSRIIGSD